MINPEQVEAAGLEVPRWAVFDVVGELATAARTERFMRAGDDELRDRRIKMGGQILQEHERTRVYKVSGEDLDEFDLTLKTLNEEFLFDLLIKRSGEPIDYAVARENDFHPVGSMLARNTALKQARRGMIAAANIAADRELLGTIRKETSVIIIVKESFIVDGQPVAASKISEYAVPYEEPPLVYQISGIGFETLLQLESPLHQPLFDILPELKGRPLNRALAEQLGIELEGDINAKRAKFGHYRRAVIKTLNESAGRDLMGEAGKGGDEVYPVLEEFIVNGQVVEATKRHLLPGRKPRIGKRRHGRSGPSGSKKKPASPKTQITPEMLRSEMTSAEFWKSPIPVEKPGMNFRRVTQPMPLAEGEAKTVKKPDGKFKKVILPGYTGHAAPLPDDPIVKLSGGRVVTRRGKLIDLKRPAEY